MRSRTTCRARRRVGLSAGVSAVAERRNARAAERAPADAATRAAARAAARATATAVVANAGRSINPSRHDLRAAAALRQQQKQEPQRERQPVPVVTVADVIELDVHRLQAIDVVQNLPQGLAAFGAILVAAGLVGHAFQ